MARENTEIVEVFRGKVIPQNSILSVSSDFPLGEGWLRMILRVNHALTNTTGTTPKSEGELSIIKGISFRTDKGERLYSNIPGRALYRYNQLKNKTAGVKDAISATAGTFRTDFELYFADPQSVRPYDTILDTRRYRSVELAIQIGGVADFLGTVGDAANVTTMDCYIERVKGALPDGARPLFFHEVANVSPVNPASVTVVDLERASNLALKRVFVGTHNSATAGVAFSGTPAANVLSELSLETSTDIPFRNLPVDLINRINKKDYQLESAIVGHYALDLVKDGSNHSALFTGELSRIQIKWLNDTLSTSQVSVLTESLRNLAA